MSLLVKRVIDILLSGCGLLVLGPLMAMIALLVGACDGGPVLFRQTRPGYKGKPFTLFKFRTMKDGRYAQGRPLPDAVRITALGKWLRQLSLDEFPQFWNVLRGDMSLVGPRPLLMQYMVRYSSEELRRHDVKPGITGWAQIHGRNAMTWQERFALDLWYVENWGLALDVGILVRTMWMVLAGEGAAHGGHVSMPEFHGVGDRGREVANE
jgi:sugar transferase EpsL